MPIYISRGRFTSDAVKGMLAKPENREEAVAKLFCYMNMRPLYQPQVMQTEAVPERMCERIWTLPKKRAMRALRSR